MMWQKVQNEQFFFFSSYFFFFYFFLSSFSFRQQYVSIRKCLNGIDNVSRKQLKIILENIVFRTLISNRVIRKFLNYTLIS